MGKGTCSLVCSTSISPLLCSCSTHRARVQFQLRGKSFFLLMSFWRKKSLVVKKRCLRQSLPVQNTNWEDVCRLFTFYNRSENNILPEKHIKTLTSVISTSYDHGCQLCSVPELHPGWVAVQPGRPPRPNGFLRPPQRLPPVCGVWGLLGVQVLRLTRRTLLLQKRLLQTLRP